MGSKRPANAAPSAGSGKPTTCKDAIKRWEDENGGPDSASNATEVSLTLQWPPIERMDAALAVLTHCERLSLSTNMIEKIAGINTLKKLRVLSLSRNQIKGFSGLETLGDTLEELWISYNAIEKMKGIQALRNLRVLYMSNNLVKEWNEFAKLSELPNLRDLVFTGNPITEGLELEHWRTEVGRRLQNLEKLDGETVVHASAEDTTAATTNAPARPEQQQKTDEELPAGAPA